MIQAKNVYKLTRDQGAPWFYDLIRNFERREGVSTPLDLNKIYSYYRLMIWETSFSGLVDPGDDQHLALLYFDIKKQTADTLRQQFADEAEQRKKSHDRSAQRVEKAANRARTGQPDTRPTYDLVLVGRGTAIAAYLNTMGPAYDHFNTLLIGTPDPWAGHRGQGIDFINHTWQAIGNFGDQVPPYDTRYALRRDFADHNRRVIQEAGIPAENICDQAVTAITQDRDRIYTVRTSGGLAFKARKVVVGSGAGPHAFPDVVTSAAAQTSRNILLQVDEGKIRERMIDLDTFMREIVVREPGGHAVVSGANAGIDAINAARMRGWNVTWLTTGRPVHLTGAQVPHALRERTIDISGAATRITISWEEHSPRKLKVEAPGQTVNADYFVYALGQTPTAPGAVGHFIHRDILAGLEAIPSEGRFTGDQSHVLTGVAGPPSREGGEPVVVWVPGGNITTPGLRQTGSNRQQGLEILGAAAYSLVGRNAPRVVSDRLGGFRDAGSAFIGMGNVAEDLPADVVTGDQIGTIRSAVPVINAFVPRYATRDSDFSTDDRTTLAIYISINFPYVKYTPSIKSSAGLRVKRTGMDDVIDDIISWRGRPKDPKGHHPYGYDDWWRSHWKRVLRDKNARGHGYWLEDKARNPKLKKV